MRFLFDYIITRSKRKTLAIHVTKDAAVEVKAPLKMPAADIDKFILQKQAWIEKTIKKVKERKESAVTLSKEQEQELKNKAQKVIPERVAYYSKIMGVSPTAVKIGDAKTRWGSCNAKNGLNFSWWLMLGDMDVINYVVIHELSHIKEHNHSKRFWAVVESMLPNYKELRKKLKTIQVVR